MSTTIRLRRGTSSQWSSANSVLDDGEIGFATDLNKIKIGDGTTSWNSLSYASLTESEINSIVNSAVSTHSSDTTNVHGITNTSALVVTTDSRLSDDRTPTDNTVSTAKIVNGAVTSAKIADGTIVNADISASAAISQSKVANLSTDLAAKATITGSTSAASNVKGLRNITISTSTPSGGSDGDVWFRY